MHLKLPSVKMAAILSRGHELKSNAWHKILGLLFQLATKMVYDETSCGNFVVSCLTSTFISDVEIDVPRFIIVTYWHRDKMAAISQTIFSNTLLGWQLLYLKGVFDSYLSCCQCKWSNCGDETVVRSSYINDGISFTGKMTFYSEYAPTHLASCTVTFPWGCTFMDYVTMVMMDTPYNSCWKIMDNTKHLDCSAIFP